MVLIYADQTESLAFFNPEARQFLHHMSQQSGFPNRTDTHQAEQPQKIATSLKFQICVEKDALYYL